MSAHQTSPSCLDPANKGQRDHTVTNATRPSLSSMTPAVLDAWEDAPAKGFARFRAANTASGVEPPDTELLA